MMNKNNESINSGRGVKMKRLINRIRTYFEAIAFAESGDFETARLIMNENTLNVPSSRKGLRRTS